MSFNNIVNDFKTGMSQNEKSDENQKQDIINRQPLWSSILGSKQIVSKPKVKIKKYVEYNYNYSFIP